MNATREMRGDLIIIVFPRKKTAVAKEVFNSAEECRTRISSLKLN